MCKDMIMMYIMMDDVDNDRLDNESRACKTVDRPGVRNPPGLATLQDGYHVMPAVTPEH